MEQKMGKPNVYFKEKCGSLLDKLDKKQREQIEDYFSTAPNWLVDSIQIQKMDAKITFVRENTPVDNIFFIARGTIKAIDYRIFGISYDFMRLKGTYAMGGMEVVMDLPTYRTTLETVSPCTMIKIPQPVFRKWLDTDIKALKQEARAMREYLLEETRNGRALLFLQGADRLSMIFIQLYENRAREGVLEIRSTRQELSEQSGLSVKTINRAVKKFEEENLIGRRGNRILINQKQYQRMKENISKIIDQ